MTPLEQASAILKAAEEATRAPWIPSRDFERTWWVHAPEGEDKCPLHNGGRGIVESNTPTDNEENDIKFVALARNTAPAIARALIEKQAALTAAEQRIAALEAALEPFAREDKTQVFFARVNPPETNTRTNTRHTIVFECDLRRAAAALAKMEKSE